MENPFIWLINLKFVERKKNPVFTFKIFIPPSPVCRPLSSIATFDTYAPQLRLYYIILSLHSPTAGLTNLWHLHPKWHAESFPGYAALTAVSFYFLCPISVCIMWRMCIHTHIWLRRLYMNYRCYQIALRVKHFYANRERCEVLGGYSSLGRWPGGDWANMWHWTKRFTLFFSNRK